MAAGFPVPPPNLRAVSCQPMNLRARCQSRVKPRQTIMVAGRLGLPRLLPAAALQCTERRFALYEMSPCKFALIVQDWCGGSSQTVTPQTWRRPWTEGYSCKACLACRQARSRLQPLHSPLKPCCSAHPCRQPAWMQHQIPPRPSSQKRKLPRPKRRKPIGSPTGADTTGDAGIITITGPGASTAAAFFTDGEPDIRRAAMQRGLRILSGAALRQ